MTRSCYISRLCSALIGQHPQQGLPPRPWIPPAVPSRATRAHNEACSRDYSLAWAGPGLAAPAAPAGPEDLGPFPWGKAASTQGS